MAYSELPMSEGEAVVFPHSLMLDERASLHLTGVLDVAAFDEGGAVLKTTLGLLNVDGEGLRVTHLSLEEGEMRLEGRVNALIYVGDTAANRKKGGKWGKGH